MTRDVDSLTEREKETLRLLAASHDAKSAARHLGLSVHTINERLRNARRKLGVSSSRAAVRRLAEAEGTPPEILVDKDFGDDAPSPTVQTQAPETRRRAPSRAWLIGGGLMVIVALVLGVALAALNPPLRPASPTDEPGSPDATAQTPAPAAAPAPAPVPARAAEPPVTLEPSSASREDAPRSQGPSPAPADAVQAGAAWLALVDRGDAAGSWAAASPTFQSRIAPEAWAETVAARQDAGAPPVRVQQYAMRSATGAASAGSVVIQYVSTSAAGARTLETLVLVSDAAGWRVSAYFAQGAPPGPSRPAP